ncbi:MAG: ATP-grasp domain-containing protein [Chloroflexota bacterium]
MATLEALPLVESLVTAPPAPPRPRTLRQLHVVVAYSLALSLERGRPEDRIADEETSAVASAIASALRGRVRRVELAPVWDDLPSVLQRYDPNQHVIFNLVESLGGRAFTEPEAPRILEAMGFLYTGASYQSLQRCANKLTTKKLIEAAGLPVARCQVFRHNGQRSVTVPLPAIVKPVAEGGSFGVTQESLARTRDELLERVERCLDLYRQPVLAEEYIAGREINVALWGNRQPTVLPVSEVVFRWTRDPLQQFVTFNSKWLPDSAEYRGTPVVCPAPLTTSERHCVEVAAIKAYQVLGLRGYGRVDMRLKDGVPCILEVNANPDLAPDAGFFRSASAAGYTYSQTIGQILKLAIAAE